MTIKDIWLVNKRVNDGKELFTLSELILLVKKKMDDSQAWDQVIDIKYFHNDKEGWMAIVHFE